MGGTFQAPPPPVDAPPCESRFFCIHAFPAPVKGSSSGFSMAWPDCSIATPALWGHRVK